MKQSTYDQIQSQIESGQLEVADNLLRPLIERNDLDARFLRSCFNLDVSMSGEEIDRKRTEELLDLSRQGNARALYVMAWAFRHGDHVEQDVSKFIIYLSAAAALGNVMAQEDLAREICIEFDWESLDQGAGFS